MGRATWGCPRYLGPSPLTAEQGVLHFSHFRFIFVCRALPDDAKFCGYSAYSRQCGKINSEFRIMWLRLRITADLCLTSGLPALSTVFCYLHFVQQLKKHCEGLHFCTNFNLKQTLCKVCKSKKQCANFVFEHRLNKEFAKFFCAPIEQLVCIF